MAGESKQEVYQDEAKKIPGQGPALKVGLIATASALAGGLAVAWWYRETLKKLQNPVNSTNLPKNGSLGEEFPGTDQDDFDNSEPGTLPPNRD
jgi:hypothetical protein